MSSTALEVRNTRLEILTQGLCLTDVVVVVVDNDNYNDNGNDDNDDDDGT